MREALAAPLGGASHGTPGLDRSLSVNTPIRRRFLLRLAVALHNYGSSAARTEYLVEKAAERLGLPVGVSVFPSLIVVAFLSGDGDPTSGEAHQLSVDASLDVDKLGSVDELANAVGKEGLPLSVAYWRLKAIAVRSPLFPAWLRVLSFGVQSASAALLFFGGVGWDALFSFFLGLWVGALNLLASQSPLFETMVEFVAALSISFAARILEVYLPKCGLCFFSMALSAMVYLLPGLALTMAVSDLVAKAYVTGACRVVYSFFVALQLGFGLAIGENLVWWAHGKVQSECTASDLDSVYNIAWFLAYAASSNILLTARLEQWPGMTAAAAIGYVVSYFAPWLGLDQDSSTVLSSFAVGITGTAFSHITGHMPLAMVLSGILLLVPGGVGVRGITAMLEKDVISGMGFVFEMLVVGLSITLGLLLAKLLLPGGLFGASKVLKNTSTSLAQHFIEDEGAEGLEELEDGTGQQQEEEPEVPLVRNGIALTHSNQSSENMAI